MTCPSYTSTNVQMIACYITPEGVSYKSFGRMGVAKLILDDSAAAAEIVLLSHIEITVKSVWERWVMLQSTAGDEVYTL